jgi:hypothetical protein
VVFEDFLDDPDFLEQRHGPPSPAPQPFDLQLQQGRTTEGLLRYAVPEHVLEPGEIPPPLRVHVDGLEVPGRLFKGAPQQTVGLAPLGQGDPPLLVEAVLPLHSPHIRLLQAHVERVGGVAGELPALSPGRHGGGFEGPAGGETLLAERGLHREEGRQVGSGSAVAEERPEERGAAAELEGRGVVTARAQRLVLLEGVAVAGGLRLVGRSGAEDAGVLGRRLLAHSLPLEQVLLEEDRLPAWLLHRLANNFNLII